MLYKDKHFLNPQLPPLAFFIIVFFIIIEKEIKKKVRKKYCFIT